VVIFYVSDRHGAVCLSVSCDMCCGASHSHSPLWSWVPKAVNVLFWFFPFFFFPLFFASLLFSLLFSAACAAWRSPTGHLRCPRFPAARCFAQLLGQQNEKRNPQPSKSPRGGPDPTSFRGLLRARSPSLAAAAVSDAPAPGNPLGMAGAVRGAAGRGCRARGWAALAAWSPTQAGSPAQALRSPGHARSLPTHGCARLGHPCLPRVLRPGGRGGGGLGFPLRRALLLRSRIPQCMLPLPGPVRRVPRQVNPLSLCRGCCNTHRWFVPGCAPLCWPLLLH